MLTETIPPVAPTVAPTVASTAASTIAPAAASVPPMPPIYSIKLEGFEGPLDLLLHLIQKEEMDIHDIQIAQITDRYLEYVNLMEQLDLDVASEFLVMAATLLHLKSQSILPQIVADAEYPIGDREQLVQQLLEYKQFKEASQVLDVYAERRSWLYSRSPTHHAEWDGGKEFEIEATLFDLLTAFRNVNERLTLTEPEENYETFEEEPITVEDKIAFIERQLLHTDQLLFDDLFPNPLGVPSSRAERIVTFLAVLELVRLGKIATVQTGPFESIYIIKK